MTAREPGRPAKDDKKIHLPNYVIRESTLERFKDLAEKEDGLSASEHLQRAIEAYILSKKRMKNVVL